jgi:hypothetical protein
LGSAVLSWFCSIAPHAVITLLLLDWIPSMQKKMGL